MAGLAVCGGFNCGYRLEEKRLGSMSARIAKRRESESEAMGGGGEAG